jgi:parallel beta-helix repeat protein
LPDGSAHFAATTADGDLWVAYKQGGTWKSNYNDGSSWSSEYDITTNSGTGKFYVEGTSLYFVRADSGDQDIHEWGGSSWSQIDSATESGPYDPTIYKIGSNYVCAYAPWVSPKQWVKAKVGTSLSNLLSSGSEVAITAAAYDANVWVDMWPVGFTDNDGDTYLFYTSERNPNDTSSEITGNIWYLEVDWDVTNDHYTYIQNAVDAATSTTINVAAGTYAEQVTIDKSLDLIGAGESTTTIKAPSSRSNTVTQGSSVWDYIVAAYASSGTIDVKMQGFTINADSQGKAGGTDGLLGVFLRDVEGTDAGLYSSTIEGFTTTAYESWGVRVYGDSDLTIDDNTLTDYTRDGIVINGDDGAGPDPAVVVSNNDLTGSSIPLNGIQIGYGASGTISGNSVTGHTRSSPWAAVGIMVYKSDGITVNGGNYVESCHYGISLIQSDACTVSGNTLQENVAFHVGLDDSNNNQVSDNTITGTAGGTEDKAIGLSNGSTGNSIGGASPADGNDISLASSGSGLLYGIYVQGTVGSGSNTVRYNTFDGGTRFVQVDGGNTGTTTVSDNVVDGTSFAGVYLNGGSAVISGNELIDTVRPVEFWGAQDVTIESNIINGSTFDGINCGAFTGSVSASGNAIYNTTGLAIHNRTTTVIDASGNWFGTDTPAGVDAEVSDYVDYTPWLDSGTDTSADPGFQGDFSTLWVDDDSPQTATTGRIQEGIDLVSGSTVNVAAGTYAENVVVDKSVTLNGAQAGVDARGRSATETMVTAASGHVLTVNASPVTVDGLQLTGSASAERMLNCDGNCGSLTFQNNIVGGTAQQAMWFNQTSSNITIQQNEIDASSFTGSYAAGHFDGSDVFDDLTISDNDFYGGGMFAGNATFNSTNLQVLDNVFDGTLLNLSSQFKNSTVDGNVFKNNGYTNAQLGLKDSTISNNTFEAAGPSPHTGYPSYALMLWGDQYGLTPSDNVTIEYNIFKYNETASPDELAHGLRILSGIDASTITVRYNKFLDGGSQGGAYALHNQGSNAVPCEKNWWSDATGPDHASNPHSSPGGGAIEGDADPVPWYATSTTTPGTENVTTTHNPIIAVSDTIQGAADAALSGDELDIVSGTFDEGPTITIDKDLTIAGAGMASTTIRPTADTGSSGDARAWWLVESGVQLDLADLTLDGNGYKVYQAIRQKGSGSVVNVTFDDIKYNESGPTYSGVAIAAFGDGPVDVTDSIFTEIGRVGVLYFGTGVAGSTYSGNSYTGKGSGDWLDYALDISAGATVSVEDSTVSDCQGVASSDGSESAGYMVTTYYGSGTEATFDGNAITDNTYGIIVGYDSSDTSDVSATGNCFDGNDYGIDTTSPPVEAEGNWWGDASGPYHATLNPSGAGDEVGDDIDFEPWVTDGCGGSSTTGNWLNTTTGVYDDLQDALDNASYGDTIQAAGGEPLAGGATCSTDGVTIDLNGTTSGPGSPFLTVTAADVTVLGPGTLDGSGSADPAILIQSGGDNFILKDVEVTGWADGVEVAASVTSFKMVSNWIHTNGDAGLQIDSGVSFDGIVTVEGNLFKNNTGNGVQNDSGTPFGAEYNSWGHLDGPTSGDGVSSDVTYTPWTFAELYLDMAPDTDASSVTVSEGTTFDVKVKADAEKLYGLSFTIQWDTTNLAYNGATFSTEWAGKCQALPGLPADEIGYFCNLQSSPAPGDPEWDATGGDIVTLSFTAKTTLSGNGPWESFFDIYHAEADTSAGATGGVKVFVNNAGYNAPGPRGDISDTDDGKVTILGKANYTGFVDLQGRPNDSGATLTVYDQADHVLADDLAEGTSTAGGGYTTAHISPHELTVGTTYYLVVDRDLYLPTTAVGDDYAHSKLLDTRPLTTLGNVVLLGGDANNDDFIDNLDATCIGGDYGETNPAGFTECGGSGSGGTSDVNGDGAVNLLDLVLMGGNYFESSSPWTP